MAHLDMQIVCAGEALIDLVAQAGVASNNTHRSLPTLTPCLGGAVFNLARALALQGVGTGYLNPLSGDLYGQQLRASLQQAGVQVMQPDPVSAPTSLAVVNLDVDKKAAYTFYREGVADRQITAQALQTLSLNPNVQIACTGCLALSPDDAAAYLPWLEHQKSLGRLIAIDINVRAAVMKDQTAYKSNIEAALAMADIIKASDDDLVFLNISAADLLAKTKAALFVLTLGAQGAQLLNRQGTVAQAAAPTDITVVDTVGAGDCFFAGFLAYFIRHVPPNTQLSQLALTNAPFWQHALDHAVGTASINVQRLGCQPPTWQEVMDVFKK
jgi:fructokinase